MTNGLFLCVYSKEIFNVKEWQEKGFMFVSIQKLNFLFFKICNSLVRILERHLKELFWQISDHDFVNLWGLI